MQITAPKILIPSTLDPMFMLQNHATPMMGCVEDLMGEKTGFLEECLSLFERGV